MEVKLQDLTLIGGLFDGWEIGVDELYFGGDETSPGQRMFFVYLKDPQGHFFDHVMLTRDHGEAERTMLKLFKKMWRGKLPLDDKATWNMRLSMSIAPRFGATRGCE